MVLLNLSFALNSIDSPVLSLGERQVYDGEGQAEKNITWLFRSM